MIFEMKKLQTDIQYKNWLADLMDEFPDMKGFSVRNLKYVRQWYLFYCSDMQTVSSAIGQQLVAQFKNESRQHAGKFVKQDISPRNLKYMRKFAQAWPDREIVQRTVAQITDEKYLQIKMRGGIDERFIVN